MASKRMRQEVDSVRKQCNTNIARLMDEVQALEMVSGVKFDTLLGVMFDNINQFMLEKLKLTGK